MCSAYVNASHAGVWCPFHIYNSIPAHTFITWCQPASWSISQMHIIRANTYLLTSQSFYPLPFSPPNSCMPKLNVLMATKPFNYELCTYRMQSFPISLCMFWLYVNKATRTEPFVSAHLRHLPAPAEAHPNRVCAASRQQTTAQFEQLRQNDYQALTTNFGSVCALFSCFCPW